MNHTFIFSIPKVDDPENKNHFDPISLCKTVYKIISKILVNRMRSILERVV